MSLEDRIEELRSLHRNLEQSLDQEAKRPLPDTDLITGLKRQKLRIKDEIAELEHSVH